MVPLRLKMLGGALLGLLVAVTLITLFSAPQHKPAPVAEPQPAETPVPATAAEPEPAPPPAPISRSKGQSDWAFFFRAGDTLSRMTDGSTLGVVVRVERRHTFADGSTGPAYVVRSPDAGDTVVDADELERRARIEAIREIRVPPARPPDAATTR